MLALNPLLGLVLSLAPPTLQDATELRSRALDAHAHGRYAEARELFERAEGLEPNASSAFNLACVCARGGDVETALEWLDAALERGWGVRYGELESLLSDPDLGAVRLRPGFAAARHRAELAWFQDMDAAYELACARAEEDPDRALEWLERALLAGFGAVADDLRRLEEDRRLDPLRQLAVFPELLRMARERHELERSALELEAAPQTLTGPAHAQWGDVASLAFDPSGRRLVVACHDRSARVFDVATGEELLALRGHANSVLCAMFSPDGTALLTGGKGVLHLSDTLTGRWLATLRCGGDVQRAEFSPDGTLVTSAGYVDRSARVFDARSGRELARLGGHHGSVWSSSFSPDGTRIVTGCQDGVARVFSWPSPRELLHIDGPGGTVRRASFDPTGRRLLLTAGRRVGVHDATTGELLSALEFPQELPLASVFAPDGRRVATAMRENACYVWDALTSTIEVRLPHPALVYDVAFAPDGETLVTSCWDYALRVWDPDTEELVRTFSSEPRVDRPSRVAFEPSGHHLLRLTEAGAVEWDLESGERTESVGAARRVAGDSGTQAPVWHDPETYDWDASEPVPSALPIDVRGAEVHVGPQGQRAYVVRARESPPGLLGALFDTTSGRELARHDLQLRPFGGDPANTSIPAARFSPDGRLLALVVPDAQPEATPLRIHGRASRVALADARNGAIGRTIPSGGEVLCLAFDPDGGRLAIGSRDGTTGIFDVETGGRRAALPRQLREVSALAFDAEGARLASGGYDARVRVWNASDGTHLASLVGHRRPVVGVAFGPRDHLASVDLGGTVCLWDVSAQRVLATWATDGPEAWICYTPQLYYVGTDAGARRSRLSLQRRPYPLELFASTRERPELVAEALAGRAPLEQAVTVPPRLVVTSPAEAGVICEEPVLTLMAHCDASPDAVESIDVWVDDQPLPEARGALRGRGMANASLALRIPLVATPGSATRVTLQAAARDGTRGPRQTLVATYEPSEAELYVLAIGVADYQDDRLDLEYPVNDVDAITGCLKSQEGALYARVHVERVVDSEVSPKRIKELRKSFLRQADTGDTIVVFVAGHAVVDEVEDYYFLTPSDTPEEPEGGIDHRLLEDLVSWDRLRAERRLLLVDTCHAEASVRGTRGTDFLSSDVLDELGTRRGIYVLAASTDTEGAREQAGNGVFTRAVVDGLEGRADRNGDGDVQVEELRAYVEARVVSESGGRQTPTMPKVVDGTNFVVTRVREAR